jgi:RNA polymerase sigma-70 factor (ECF subfamily)
MATSAAATHSRIASLVEQHLPTVWNFCSRMTLSVQDSEAASFETFERAAAGEAKMPSNADDAELWLLKIASFVIEQKVPPTPEVDFDLLDETLRSEATRTHEVSSLSQPEREYLLWELKQGCMTSVINCLSPGERVAFVMSSVMGKSDEQAAKALNIKVSAFKVRLSRARKKIGDYLAPRCEHVDPRNPCHCPSRIGIALQKGFIAPPQTAQVQLRTPKRPFDQEIKSRDATNIFRTLPNVDIPTTLVQRLKQAVSSGAWKPAPAPPRR